MTNQTTSHYAPHAGKLLSAERPKIHKVRHGVVAAMEVMLVLIVVGGALLYFVGHGSLAPLYVGSARVNATDSSVVIGQKVQRAVASYKLSVAYTGGKAKQFPITSTGLTVNTEQSAHRSKTIINHTYLQRLAWWRPIKIPLVSKIDNRKLELFINQNATQVTVPAKDASLSVYDGVVTITPETIGKGAQIPDAQTAIARAIRTGDTQNLTLKPTTLRPAIRATDLSKSKAAAEAIIRQPVSITVAGRALSPTAAEISTWLDFTPVTEAKTVDVTINSGKIVEYIKGITAAYTRTTRNQVVVNTNDGAVVLDYGASGMDVTNKDKVAAAIGDALSHHQPALAELTIQYVPAQTTEVPAYAKWIVADVTTKRMYAYEGTTLIRSFLISAGAPATPTVIGQYTVYRKYVSQDMYGSNVDGSRYYQPAVPYVLYFSGGYAIHGNYWRPASWFGNINSSHGCLGVTPDDGAWIYNWAPVGTPVITHR